MKQSSTSLLLLLVVVLAALSQAIYTVDQRQYAIKFQFGEIKGIQTEPGLAFKIPLIQNVKFFEKRNMTLINSETDSIMTAEKKPLLIDFVVLWRIVDVGQYYRSVAGDEETAKTRIKQTVRSKLMEEITRRKIHDVISVERDKITSATREKTSQEVRPIGVEIVDIRLRRVDFPTEVTKSVYARMRTERERVANELRSTGEAEQTEIKAEADRKVRVMLADAYKEAQETRGKGDQQAAAIYAKAYSADPEFYNFYRSLDAYKASLQGNKDVLVLDPTSDFFRYFKKFSGSSK